LQVTALRQQLEVGNCQMQQAMLAELAELDRNHEADLQVAMSTLQSSFEEKARRVASFHACTVARLENEAAEAEAARAAVQHALEEEKATRAAMQRRLEEAEAARAAMQHALEEEKAMRARMQRRLEEAEAVIAAANQAAPASSQCAAPAEEVVSALEVVRTEEEKQRRMAEQSARRVMELETELSALEEARLQDAKRLNAQLKTEGAERRHRETMFSRESERLEAQIAALKRAAEGARGDIMKTVVAPLEAELMDTLARHRVERAKFNKWSEGDATGKRRWLWMLTLVAFELLRELRRVSLHGFAARTTAEFDSSWAATVITAAALTVWLSTAACAGRTAAAVHA
jgi:hypothetical protein